MVFWEPGVCFPECAAIGAKFGVHSALRGESDLAGLLQLSPYERFFFTVVETCLPLCGFSSRPTLRLASGGEHQASLSGHPVSSCIGKRARWEHWGTRELADLSSLNVLISFDRLQNKYGPTNCHFYGYLQPRHFVNLRTNISQRKSGS